jgi:hypothetical protein
MVAKKSIQDENFVSNLNEIKKAIETETDYKENIIDLIKKIIPEYQENNAPAS